MSGGALSHTKQYIARVRRVKTAILVTSAVLPGIICTVRPACGCRARHSVMMSGPCAGAGLGGIPV